MTVEHHLTVQRTARYYTIGHLPTPTENAPLNRIWFCLHGFGQLAQYFSRKFAELDDGQTLVVVPEGLSRSYLNGDYKRVGASWLTREDRDHEISDFLGYLNTLYDLILDGRDPKTVYISLLGFSQGAATACRWLANGHIRVDRLILWAGYFPDGLRDMIAPSQLEGIETHYVYGRQDQYIEQMDNLEGYLQRLQSEVPTLTITAFAGDHRVEPAVLKQLTFRD